jgi:hypothetical protein
LVQKFPFRQINPSAEHPDRGQMYNTLQQIQTHPSNLFIKRAEQVVPGRIRALFLRMVVGADLASWWSNASSRR